MSSPAARKTWQGIVGFCLGGFAAQTLGIMAIALYQALHGNFNWELHLFALSWPERLFCVVVPIIPAALLWRQRRYVSVGMVVYAVLEWFLTAPKPWAK